MSYTDPRIELYKDSIKLAKEYIDRAEATLMRCGEAGLECSYSKENASTKRMSMELSNVLVKIRRGS
ncbi:MAG: hypothetical protein KAJ03_10720 [Gammaproteobacteria bacterium]|nr:hypothetical protein [Gammaproteobacteria bacterium]